MEQTQEPEVQQEPEQSGPAFQNRDIILPARSKEDDPDPARLMAEMRHTANATVARLSKEPQVPVRLPKIMTRGANKNIPESAVPVTINGARYAVPRGRTVLVPTSVYRILEQAGYLDGSEAELNVPEPMRLRWPGRAV